MTNQDDTFQYKIDLIRDGILSATYHMQEPEIYIHSFIDYLYIFFQRPLVFNFWLSNEDQSPPLRVFSSLKDPTFSHVRFTSQDALQYGYKLHNTNYLLTAHPFDAEDIAKSNQPVPVDKQAIRDIESLLCFDSIILEESVFKFLKTSLRYHQRKRKENNTYSPTALELDYQEDAAPLLDEMREVVDKAIGDAAKSTHLQLELGKHKLLNIIVFTRSTIKNKLRCGSYNYTTARKLTKQQIPQLQKWMGCGCPDAQKPHCPIINEFGSDVDHCQYCLEIIETHFCDETRAVVDLVYSSGSVEFHSRSFGARIEQYTDGDIIDKNEKNIKHEKLRREVLECIFPQNKGSFYIPIHVNGIPWMILQSVVELNSDFRNWRFNYGLYRDIAHRVAAIVREESHALYCRLLSRKLIEEIKEFHHKKIAKHVVMDNINDRWQKSAQLYPFQLAETSLSTSEDSSELPIPGFGSLWLKIHPNPFLASHVDWQLYDDEKIRLACVNALEEYTQSKGFYETQSLGRTSHLIKSPLRNARRWLRAAMSENKRDYMQATMEQLDICLSLHDFSISMIIPEKREAYIRDKQRACSASEFINLLYNQGKQRIHRIKECIDRDTQAIANSNINFTEFDDLQNTTIYYFEEQLCSLWDEVFSNIGKHGSPHNADIRISVHTSRASSGGRFNSLLSLCISNEVKCTAEALNDKVRQLNEMSSDHFGASMIVMPAQVLWGSPPRWSVGSQHSTVFEISVPIGGVK